MLCNGGEKLGIPSAKIMGKGLDLICTNNNSTTTSTTTTSSNSSTPTSTSNSSKKKSMIHVSSSEASNPAVGARVMDRPSAQDHQAALKCPRCDSSNTKFCYYNNYSLSQPRHFCKACKRYWTRGGTLRNVPVGGGCRKNKRVKKSAPATGMGAATDPHNSHSLLPYNPLTSFSAPSSSALLDATTFYALQSAASSVDMNHALPSLVSNMQIPSCTAAFDLQPQPSTLGLGFASNHREDEYIGLLQQLPASSSAIYLMNDYPLFSSLSSGTAASLLVSSLKQPKKVEDYQHLFTNGELETSDISGSLGMMKEVKLEGQITDAINNNSSSFIDQWQFPSQDSTGAFGSAATTTFTANSNASYLYWNAAYGGGWLDAAANCGSSVAL